MSPDAASASAFREGSDELGVYVRVSVDANVFGQTAVLKTAYWFTDHHYLFLAFNPSTGLLDVEFRPKNPNPSLDSLKAACGEFWNHLLDQAVRQKVLEETSAVRDALLRKAFFEAKASLPPGIVSNEVRLPNSGQTSRDDPVGAGSQD